MATLLQERAVAAGVIGGGAGYLPSWTPALGSNEVTNGGMEGAFNHVAAGIDIASGWDSTGLTTGQDTAAADTVNFHSGLSSQRLTLSVAPRGINEHASFPVTLGVWYSLDAYVYLYSGTMQFRSNSKLNALVSLTKTTPTGSWLAFPLTGRCVTAGNVDLYAVSVTGAADFSIDDISLAPIPLANTLGYSYTTANGDFDIQVPVKCVKGTQIGFACNLDSKTNPKYGAWVYIDGTNIYLDSLSNGTWTSVLAGTAITYVDNAPIRLRKTGTTYSVYYNQAQKGTDKTINDAGINNNTLHAQFLTYGGNAFTARPSVLPFS